MKKNLNDDANVWIADFETEAEQFYNKFGFTKTWLCYVENIKTDTSKMTVDIKTFLDFIIYQMKKQKRNQFVYFHNLSFDGMFLLYYIRNRWNVETVINDFKKIYEIKIKPLSSKSYVVFRCSLLIFMTSVANLPHSTKSSIDYHSIRNYKSIDDASDDEKNYIIQDVKTVKINLKKLQDEKGVILNRTFKTMASISYNDLKKTTDAELKKHKQLSWNFLYPTLSIDDDNYIRNAYLGGYTYLNPKYQNVIIEQPMISFDRVSSYPSVMMYEELPSGKPYYSITKPKYKLYIVRFRCFEAKIKKGYMPFIAPHRKMRYVFDNIYPPIIEDVMLTMSSIDFELFTKYYDVDIEILDYCYFTRTTKGIFNKYINEQYTIKETTKAIIKSKDIDKTTDKYHDAVFNNFWAKLKLNSPYGKFGTNPTIITSKPTFAEDGKIEFIDEIETKEENKFYLPLAVFITAYARKKLIEQIQENAQRFVYCDTDSIHLLGTETPSSLNGLIANKLDHWESEGIANKSLYLKPKRYLKLKRDANGKEYIARTIGGLNRSEHHRINFDNFANGIVISQGKKISKNVKGGRIIASLDFTFR